MAAFQDIGSGIAYDYGIDPQGKMYIWDKWANKMVYYGEPKGGYNMIVTLNVGHGAKTNFQGDKTNGAWKSVGQQAETPKTPSNITVGNGGGGGGYTPAPKVLDRAQLESLDSLLGTIDTAKEQAKQKAAIKRDTAKREKDEEKNREKGKYEGKKLGELQTFAGAKTDTDLNTRNTLENLVSSLSTLGLGGGRALTRQILDAANMANRKANATQATNNKGLDDAFNEFSAANENDIKKIQDQYGYDVGEAERKWAQDRQNTFYKKADVYNAADDTGGRQSMMNEGNALNGVINRAAFLNPSYTGETRQMATPELADYQQDIARYDTSAIGNDGVTPVLAGDGAMGAGNLAVKAIAVNDQDLGIKKKTEGDLAYGV